MPRVLIVGCGYAGEALADLLAARRWGVEGWTASAESAEKLGGKPYPVRAVDLADASQVRARPAEFDLVVHCASTRGGDVDHYRRVYWQGARNLLEHFAKASILFVSSTSVYAQTGGAWVTEQSAAEPPHEKGKVLRETEEIVLNRGGTVARLAGIYGPGRSALLTRFQEGRAIIDPENDRFVNQVHRDDIATALFFLLDGQPLSGEIYNVADGQPLLLSECYEWLAGKLKQPLPPIGKSHPPGKRGRSNKRVSNAKLRELGWAPQYRSFAEAMEKSILPSFQIPATET